MASLENSELITLTDVGDPNSRTYLKNSSNIFAQDLDTPKITLKEITKASQIPDISDVMTCGIYINERRLLILNI